MVQKIVSTGFLTLDGKVLVIQRSHKEKFLPGYYELEKLTLEKIHVKR